MSVHCFGQHRAPEHVALKSLHQKGMKCASKSFGIALRACARINTTDAKWRIEARLGLLRGATVC
jgi:hypothetical protein